MTEQSCLFCERTNLEKHRIFAENNLFYARWDNFPVSIGHAEIVAKRHVESFLELTQEELARFYDLLLSAKAKIETTYDPDGFNIGVNEGEAAGRTVHHLHIHLIPRYKGDVPNPRGGIRNVIPGKGDY